MKSLILSLLAISVMAQAQTPTPTPTCTPGFSNGRVYNELTRLPQPYLATIKATFEHPLPEGNIISGTATYYAARDAQGKTLVIQPILCQRGESGEGKLSYAVNVNDYAGETFADWQVSDHAVKVAHVTHFHRVPPAPVVLPPAPSTPEQIAQRKARLAAAHARSSQIKVEDLGMKDIAGVEAHGSRTTRTIPAGEEGNKEPLMIAEERWDSKDLGIVMMAILDDPRYGKTVYEVTALDRSLPDPSLFLPPADYKIEERFPDGTVAGR